MDDKEYMEREAFYKLIEKIRGKDMGVTVQDIARNTPNADVFEEKHGHWQITDAYPHWVCCSECHVKFVPNVEWIGRYDIPTKYCPNCGACMDGENLSFWNEETK